MNKGLLTLTGLAILTILATSGIKKVNYSSGITGQASSGCSCHSTHKGTITVSGIGTTAVKGQKYPITVLYNPAKSYSAWGIDIIANTGTLTTTNSNLSLSSNEATHNSPFSSTGTTYTYTGLTWQAPATVTTSASTVINVACVAGTSGGNGYWATGSVSTKVVAVNPVEFAAFKASWLGENRVSVEWKTATETNSNYFEVERSFNEENFVPVAKVSAAGVSESMKSYSFNDVVTGSNFAYYRIKEMDVDGTPTYSEIKAVNVKPVKNFVKTLYPNPVVSGQPVNLQYVALENGKVNIELYNCLGKKMNSLTTDAVTGENDIKFNLGRFVSPGIYYVVVSNGAERIAQLPVSVQ